MWKTTKNRQTPLSQGLKKYQENELVRLKERTKMTDQKSLLIKKDKKREKNTCI